MRKGGAAGKPGRCFASVTAPKTMKRRFEDNTIRLARKLRDITVRQQ
jgi:hypothetical protein